MTESNYCSRCGFLLTGTLEVLRSGGIVPNALPDAPAKPGWRRNRGLKKGLFIFLMSFLVVPIIAILTIAADVEPYAVVISALLLFVGGLLRMAYALLFESPDTVPAEEAANGVKSFTGAHQDPQALPPQRQAYAPPAGSNWRDTNDLQPASVTENTTKLLLEDEQMPLEHGHGR